MNRPTDDERLFERMLDERDYKEDFTLGDDGPPDEQAADLDERDDDLGQMDEEC